MNYSKPYDIQNATGDKNTKYLINFDIFDKRLFQDLLVHIDGNYISMHGFYQLIKTNDSNKKYQYELQFLEPNIPAKDAKIEFFRVFVPDRITDYIEGGETSATDLSRDIDRLVTMIKDKELILQITSLLPTLDPTKNYTLLFLNNKLDSIEVPKKSNIKDKLLIGTDNGYIAIPIDGSNTTDDTKKSLAQRLLEDPQKTLETTFKKPLEDFLAQIKGKGSGYMITDNSGNISIGGGVNSSGNANNPQVLHVKGKSYLKTKIVDAGKPTEHVEYEHISSTGILDEVLDEAVTPAKNGEFIQKTSSGYRTYDVNSDISKKQDKIKIGKNGQILEWKDGKLIPVDKVVSNAITLAELQTKGIIPNESKGSVLGWNKNGSNQLTNIAISTIGSSKSKPSSPTEIPIEVSAGVIGDGIQLESNGQDLYTTAGFARFVDRVNPKAPIVIDVDLPQITKNITLDNTTKGKTWYPYLLYDKKTKKATLELQDTRPTFTERTTSLRLYVGYARTSGSNVFETFSEPTLLTAADDQIRETWKALGGKSTSILTLDSISRQFSQTDGVLYHYGAGYNNRTVTPFELKLNSQTINELNIISSNQISESSKITDDYDVGGILTAIDDGKFTIQRIFRYKTGELEILLSKRQFDASMKPFAYAWDIFQKEQRDLPPTYLQEDGILEGFVIVEKGGKVEFFSIKENPLHSYYSVITTSDSNLYAKVDSAGKRLEFVDPPFAKKSDIPTDFYKKSEIDAKISSLDTKISSVGKSTSNSSILYDFPLIRYEGAFSIGNNSGSIHKQFFNQPSEKIEITSHKKNLINLIDTDGNILEADSKIVKNLKYNNNIIIQNLPNDKWAVYRLLLDENTGNMSIVLPTILSSFTYTAPLTFSKIKTFVENEVPISEQYLKNGKILVLIGFCNGKKQNFINDGNGAWFNVNHDTRKNDDIIIGDYFYIQPAFNNRGNINNFYYQLLNGKFSIYAQYNNNEWKRYHSDTLDDIVGIGIPNKDFTFHATSSYYRDFVLMDLKNKKVYAVNFYDFNSSKSKVGGSLSDFDPQYWFNNTPLKGININVLNKIVRIWFVKEMSNTITPGVIVTNKYDGDTGYRTYFPSNDFSLTNKSDSIEKRVISAAGIVKDSIRVVQYEGDPKIYIAKKSDNFQKEMILPDGDTVSSTDQIRILLGYGIGSGIFAGFVPLYYTIILSDQGNIYEYNDSSDKYTKLNGNIKVKKLITKYYYNENNSRYLEFDSKSYWFIAIDESNAVYYYSNIVKSEMGIKVANKMTLISDDTIGKIMFADKCIDGAVLINDKNEIYVFGRNYQYSLGFDTTQVFETLQKAFDLNKILQSENTFIRQVNIETAWTQISTAGYYQEYVVITLDNGSFVITGGVFDASTGYKGFTLVNKFTDVPHVYPSPIEPQIEEYTLEVVKEEVKKLKIEIEEKESEINLRYKEIDEKIAKLTKDAGTQTD